MCRIIRALSETVGCVVAGLNYLGIHDRSVCHVSLDGAKYSNALNGSVLDRV